LFGSVLSCEIFDIISILPNVTLKLLPKARMETVMKDINYDLVKLLHKKLDTIAQLERHYIKDAEEAKCHSIDALKQILVEEREHAEILAQEIGMRSEAGKFN